MADKYIYNNQGVLREREAITTSAGSADAGKIPALDGSGRLPSDMLPVGIGADTATIQASENLAAGDYVNVHSVGGAFRVRKADATTAGKEAHGFVLASATSGANATVYLAKGTNTQVTGQVPGVVYLSTTPGLGATTPPTGSGQVVQRLGTAASATSVAFAPQQPVVLA